MPIITVFPDVPRAYNRVEVNWADTPSVEFARVLRVDVESGVCTPLRPYICFEGDYLTLSCGHGIFWDTEVPLDRQVYYITEGLASPCIPAGALISDTFTRVVAADWGTTDTGEVWTQVLPPGATASVSGTQGLISVDSADETVFEAIPVGEASFQVQIQFFTTEVATGAALLFELDTRLQDVNNYHRIQLLANTDSTLTGRLGKVVAGVGSFVAATSDSYAINTAINVVAEFEGNVQRLKWWSDPNPEPTVWFIETNNTEFPNAGDFRVRMGTTAGNTNAPITMAADNLSITSLCAPCTPVTADTSATPTTMPSNGAFRLKDPVRPCNDLYVPLCFTSTDPGCLPGSGIFFAQMDDEGYEPNSIILNPTNASLPLAIARQRRGKSSAFQLVTRTFTDRDNLIKINQPGSPLLLQGPANYGIYDTYMSIGTLNIVRGLSDHRFPVRINNLPFVEVSRPAGPSLGVCGSRMTDLCDVYATFDEMAAAGLTWDDLIRGRAGDENPITGYRTFDDVQAEFADFNAVDNGTRTFTDLLVGN